MVQEPSSGRSQVAALRAAVDSGELQPAKLLLHPYLHWTLADGTQVRGRTNVMRALADVAELGMPVSVELRDDQIYRWVSAEEG